MQTATPAYAWGNAQRLSTMRGAVMKVGQLMSMDGQGVLPPAFAELLGGLHDQAHTMPATQLAEVLERGAGTGVRRAVASALQAPDLCAHRFGQYRPGAPRRDP